MPRSHISHKLNLATQILEKKFFFERNQKKSKILVFKGATSSFLYFEKNR